MATAASPINPEDRLFHLILALMSTTHGLTKEQILSSVRGYREDTEAGMAKESIERRFERDKDALRELGIPLEAIIPPEDDGNNKNTLYRIPKGDYDIPSDISFSQRDIALLNLAAAIWREGSLSRDAHIAKVKIASFGLHVDEKLLGFAPIISTRDPALAAIRAAIEDSRVISFNYLKPGDQSPLRREISPWALVNHEGRWHVYGKETQSDSIKTFLLRRIVSAVTTVNSPAEPAPSGAASEALAELERLYRNNVATLEVREGSDAFAVLSQREGTSRDGERLLVHYTDPAIFADQLSSLGDDVYVVSPEDVRRLVVANLEALVANHG